VTPAKPVVEKPEVKAPVAEKPVKEVQPDVKKVETAKSTPKK